MITSELLAKIFPGTKRALRDRFIAPLNLYCAKYAIDSQLRICAFLATGGYETDYLRTTTEYASGADYEGRMGLGNTQPGDGRKFRGHGFFQTTGRSNHRAVTLATFSRLQIDFEKTPERLAEIPIAVESACIFWAENNIAKYADKKDFFGVSGLVNRGSATKKANAWEKRKELYEKCLSVIPKDFSFSQAAPPIEPTPQPTDPTPAPVEPPTVSTNPVVLTPTATGDENAALKDFSDKYLKHCKNDSAKNIALVVAARIGAAISALWTVGITGKIFLIVISIIIAAILIYAIAVYHKRLTGWLKTIFNSLFNS